VDRLIEAESLAKTYPGGTVAVRDVSISVRRGELYMLMGLSGSGKSTVLRMLNRLVEPASGTVRLDGRDLAALSEHELREVRNRRIAMVFQHFALLPHKSVRYNAGYGLRIRGVPRTEREDAAQAALEQVGLGSWGDRRPGELSGGMRQRVGLARALATGAELLLMDEPFSALGIRQVDPEVVEAARAFGAPSGRVLADVQLPLALPSIMAGINQVIMLALSMVVVAGLAGADGLGATVTSAVTQLDIGAGFEGGLAVVILAVYLDRITSALATPGRTLLAAAVRRGRVPAEPAGARAAAA
jgi:ABC-type lipoprotein export system ATPase subunit